jgi:glycerol-1-phosphatase
MAQMGGSWVLDLDGVVWLSHEPVAGSAEAVDRLRERGTRVLFATNNSAPTTGELLERLGRAGIDAAAGDLVTSAHAAASMLDPGSSAMVYGEGGLLEALAERGVKVLAEGVVDSVVLGWTRRFDFEMLTAAAAAVRGGARLVGTNEDPTHPTPDRLLPGTGALVAAVATAAQRTPEMAGKPHEPFAALLRARAPDVSVVVGDRPATDGLLARRLDVPYALVLSGVTTPEHGTLEVEPDEEATDLLALVKRRLSRGPEG